MNIDWDKWNEVGGPKYPHEKVVQFTFRNFGTETRKGCKALDLGCGSGVHSFFLANEGFSVSFSDISRVGVNNTKLLLGENRLDFDSFETGSIEETNFKNDYFDYIICVGVFDSARIDSARKAIPKVYSLLKKGGQGIFIFASNSDFRVIGSNPWNLYGYEENEVIEMFEQCEWNVLHIDRYITTFESGKLESNDFLVTLQK